MLRLETERMLPRSPGVVLRGGLLVAGVVLVSGLAGSADRVRAADTVVPASVGVVSSEIRMLADRLQTSEGELAVSKVQLDRLNAVFDYSARYQIPADLAAAIYDIALSEGIDPALGFRLVKVESGFKLRATSTAGAIGYTQIRPATAKFYEPGLSVEQLYERDVNLRIGFRFLKDLMNRYEQNLELALLAYNRGPARVAEILAEGGDPSNGYETAVLRGIAH